MSNAIKCIDQKFAFKNSGILRLALIFNLSNPGTTILHAKIGSRLRATMRHVQFLSGDQYDPMAQ